ncbi:gamma carbonic anhydrase family protein [Amnibacterium flavum]|uniref:Gamma carbonic anhydrase family protein n=1 Tax=Amnibacterium flavum TaxID=2173173 RepID=A0A2V1HYX5_9MICO|nr:gamma carbonic anhydrase family protein [Amnibacterium flavum]PVZ96107.1 gamma carbonic anhydrase family protein [Amnibacterium flavum]
MTVILPFGGVSPAIDPSAFVAENATIIGRVTLGPRSSVFFGAVLRADRDEIVLGEGSNVQDNVVLHGDPGVPTRIGARVSIGHSAVVHGAVVEDDCLIGMGATLLNRSVIGTGSLVAAGAVVLEDTVIPPGSLVAGVPAKVRRELTEDERAGIRRNAETYLELSAAYREAAADGESAL